MAPPFEPPSSSCAVELKLYDIVTEATSKLSTIEHAAFSYGPMLDAIREHAMISYELDVRRGIEHYRNQLRDMSEVIRRRAEVYAVYQGSAKLWHYLLSSARAHGLRKDDSRVGQVLFGLLGWMAGCFHSVAADPLMYECEESTRDDLDRVLDPHIRELHREVMKAKVIARLASAHAYLDNPDEPMPSPLGFLDLGIGAIMTRDFANGMEIDVISAAYEDVGRCMDAYRSCAAIIVRERHIHLPVLKSRVPVHTFCESNQARALFTRWVRRTVRKATAGPAAAIAPRTLNRSRLNSHARAV